MSNEGLQQEGRNVHLRYPSIDPSLPLRTHRIIKRRLMRFLAGIYFTTLPENFKWNPKTDKPHAPVSGSIAVVTSGLGFFSFFLPAIPYRWLVLPRSDNVFWELIYSSTCPLTLSFYTPIWAAPRSSINPTKALRDLS